MQADMKSKAVVEISMERFIFPHIRTVILLQQEHLVVDSKLANIKSVQVKT